MSKIKKIPEFDNYKEMAEFWDKHSLADYWDQTEPAEFEISPNARRRYYIPVDKDLLNRVHKLAQIRGLSTETLANLLIEQRLQDIEVNESI
ncbi:hypothetical protein JXJ21_11655 [candidate division KSB1 bacterium]|nr:hypothetical protein [candidate division KSB1 bacterium]